MNKYTKLLGNTVIFGIGNFTTKLIYFFLMPIYTVALSSKDFGIADLLNNSLQLVIPIFTLCITDSIFRFALDKDVNFESLLNNGLKIITYGIIAVWLVVFVVYSYDSQSYWIYFAFLYFTESIKSLFAQFARGIGKVREYAINGIIAALILLIFSYVFLVIFKLGINGYLLSFIFANLASIIYLLFIVKLKDYLNTKATNRALLKAMLAFSLPLIPNMLSWWLTNISSRYIIAAFCGISSSGLFSAASKLPALINIISSIFQLAWQFSSVKEYQDSKDSDFFSTVFKYYSFIIIMSSSIIIVLIPFISGIILKGEFYDAWIYTPLLFYTAILNCYSVYFGTFYSVVKNNKKTMYTTMTGAIINILLGFILIPLIGVIGALISNVISYIVIVILRSVDVKKYVRIDANWGITIFSLSLLLAQCVFLSMPSKVSFMIVMAVPILVAIIYRKQFVDFLKFVKLHKIDKG